MASHRCAVAAVAAFATLPASMSGVHAATAPPLPLSQPPGAESLWDALPLPPHLIALVAFFALVSCALTTCFAVLTMREMRRQREERARAARGGDGSSSHGVAGALPAGMSENQASAAADNIADVAAQAMADAFEGSADPALWDLDGLDGTGYGGGSVVSAGGGGGSESKGAPDVAGARHRGAAAASAGASAGASGGDDELAAAAAALRPAASSGDKSGKHA